MKVTIRALLLLSTLCMLMFALSGNADQKPSPLVTGNDANGTITLMFEPCLNMPDKAELDRLKLPQEALQRAVGDGVEGRIEACWVSFEPPASMPGVEFVPVVNIIRKDGVLFEWLLSDFGPAGQPVMAGSSP